MMMSELLTPVLLFLAVGLPWIAALATAILLAAGIRTGRWQQAVSIIATLPALAAILFAEAGVKLSLDILLLGATLELTDFNRPFLLLTGLIWFAGAMAASQRLLTPGGATNFHLFFQAALAGNMGLVLAADAITFYVHFVTLSVAAYGLVIHDGTLVARRAGLIYILFVLAGEILILPALWIIAAAADGYGIETMRVALAGHDHASGLMAALTLGFGIKAGLFLVHFWLPLAHPVAPIPASAILSGAMIKAGVLGWLTFLPLGTLALPWLGNTLIALGVAGIYVAAIAGVLRSNPKEILAYSSVSQIGLMASATGLALLYSPLATAAIAAISLLAVHHGLAKAALFLVNALKHSSRTIRFAAAIVPAAALVGLPATSGDLAKETLMQVARSLQDDNGLITQALYWSSMATGLLMVMFLWRLLAGPGNERVQYTVLAAILLLIIAGFSMVYLM